MANLGETTWIAQGSRKHHNWYIKLSETSTSTLDNTSSMSIKLTMGSTGYTWSSWGSAMKYRVKVYKTGDANTVYYNTGWVNAPNHYPNANSNLTWINGDTFSVGHSSDGSRSVTVSFEFDDNANGYNNGYYTPGDASGTLGYTLTKIPRYLSFTGFGYTGYTETTASFSWSVSNERDWTQYSLNGGSWTDAGDSGTTSGSFSISGLSAGTQYSLKIRCRRKDSQLWTDSSAVSFTTYQWPYVSAVGTTALTIGNAQSLTLYNPLGRNCTVYMKQNNKSGTQLWSGTTSSTKAEFTPAATSLYQSIPNSKSGTAYYYCIYSGHELNGKTGTYTCVESSCRPTFNSNPISYVDTNEKTKNVMKDNGVTIIQNQSTLSVTFSAATARQYAAGISKYKLTLGGITKEYSTAGTYSFGAVNLVQNTDLKLSAIDSRGYESVIVSKTVVIIPWSKPTIEVDLQRKNRFEATADLNVLLSSFSSLNGKNAAYKKLTYQYYVAGKPGESTSPVTLTLKEGSNTIYYQEIQNLDQNLAYNFVITVQDGLSSETYIYPLDRGIPILMVDADTLGVGVNCIPTGDGLYVKHIDNDNTEGCLWYEGRDNATARNMNTTTDSFHPVITQKTKNGTWSVGSLGGQDGLYFSYVSDTDYNNKNNVSKTYILGTDGRFNGGVQVTSGTSAPNNANGADGDVYIQI